MKFKKYRKFTIKQISFIKFFYIFHKEIEKDFKKYKRLYKECEAYDINYCDVCSDEKIRSAFEKISIYKNLINIFETGDNDYTLFFLSKNKKSNWTVSLYDETGEDYYDGPYGTSGIEMMYTNKYKKVKNLKIILFDWN